MRGVALLFLSAHLAWAAPKKVAVFVALCDNASQGIIRVPTKIGDGDMPAENLYWGCTEGFSACFRASRGWQFKRKETPDDGRILERQIYLHETGKIEVMAEAWRGSEIKGCLAAFETALVSGKHDLCAYVGHNVLMDGAVPPPAVKAAKPCDAIVLCCVSDRYFKERLAKLGARPVLLTTQLMYPGSFLLRDSLPVWGKGGTPADIRLAAAAGYSKNQNISKKAAAGVFSVLP